jgi:hypothetical protein
LRDSLTVDPSTGAIDTLHCIDYHSEWLDVSGCFDSAGRSDNTRIESRESIVITATVKYRRFLGFLWRTKKIKSQQVDAVSRNPNTEIVAMEWINITR